MDASPRKVEHAKAPAASADPAADLALVKRLRLFCEAGDGDIFCEAADAIERLLRERDAARQEVTAWVDNYESACKRAAVANELLRRWEGESGEV